MSRIGKKIIQFDQNIKVQVQDSAVLLSNPKGEIKVDLPQGIKVTVTGDQISVEAIDQQRQTKAFHGLVRSLIQNAVIGLTTGYKKTLKLVGTGYRVQAKGKDLSLALGFSHTIEFAAPAGVTFKVEGNNIIRIDGVNKQIVGQVAAEIRALRTPDAYKGKGVRYEDEVVKLKPGKTAA